ncbi:retrovirus-related pol polyprotein from transposon TNT 1-94, partial [Trifolium medium]|nr:retrovirus-related pol polyprotein from transposon TNT 1-94 [Trifolium medium]
SHKKGQQNDEEANIAQDQDSNTVLMMATTCEGKSKNEEWYIDSRCSNHTTSHKEWLTNIDTSKKTTIKLADSKSLAAKGIGNIVIRGNYGKKVIIGDVLLLPDMNCNLLSTCQLVEKGFSFTIDGDSMKLFDAKKSLVLKSLLSKNKTYNCSISSDKMTCMSGTINGDIEAPWYMRYGHLNFRTLSELKSKDLVHGLLMMNARKEICEIYIKSK